MHHLSRPLIYASLFVFGVAACGNSANERVTLRVEMTDKHGSPGSFGAYGLRTYADPIHYLTGSVLESVSSSMGSTQFAMDVRTNQWVESLADADSGADVSRSHALAWESRQFFTPFEADSKPKITLLISTQAQRATERTEMLGAPYTGTHEEVMHAWLGQWAQVEAGSITGAYTVSFVGNQLRGEQRARDLKRLEELPDTKERQALRLAMTNDADAASPFGWWSAAPFGAGNPPRELYATREASSRNLLALERAASDTGFVQREFLLPSRETLPQTKLARSNTAQPVPPFVQQLQNEIAWQLAPVQALFSVHSIDSRSVFTQGADYSEWTFPAEIFTEEPELLWAGAPDALRLLGASVNLTISEAVFGHDVELLVTAADETPLFRQQWLSISTGAPFLRATAQHYSPWSANSIGLRVANFYDFGAFTTSRVFAYWDSLFAAAQTTVAQ